MSKSLQIKIKEFLDQRQHVLHEEHERKYATQKIMEMVDRELQKVTPKKSLRDKIFLYKSVLKMAKVPKVIIENPQFIRSMPITQEDIDWAKDQIAEQQKKK